MLINKFSIDPAVVCGQRRMMIMNGGNFKLSIKAKLEKM